MKILKISHTVDNPSRYSYKANYDVWDRVGGDHIFFSHIRPDFDFNKYDVLFLPAIVRLKLFPEILKKIKDSKAKKVLFDNDSCYHRFSEEAYQGMDYIFYRDSDKNGNTPKCPSMWLPWWVDTDYYLPSYGGSGVSFNCTVNAHYPLRVQIHRSVLRSTQHTWDKYVKSLQDSAGSIHTDSPTVRQVRAKALEIAACGTQIISNRTSRMDYFFPDELVTYFDNMDELKEIVKNFEPNIEVQKELRHIVETKHSSDIRAKEVIEKVKSIL